MQINLKQKEITEALKMFISHQGINLTGKTVAIEFTSGRKDNGLSAELIIEDAPVETGKVNTTPTPAAEEPAAKPTSLFAKE